MGERYEESDGVEKAKIPLLRGQHEAEDDGDILVETKKLWRIVGPAIFTRISTNLILVITQAFAGHLGELELAAISIVSNVIIGFNVGLLLGMASALQTLCGQAFGAKRYDMLGVYLQRSWIVLFLFSILLLPMYFFATPILKYFGQPDDIAELSGSIAVWVIPIHFAFAFVFPLNRFLQCQLKNRFGLYYFCSVRVANELGAGNGKGARFAMIISVTQSLVIGIVFSVLVVFLHDQIGWIFSSSEAVINAVKNLSILLAFTILLNSVQPVLSGVAVGSGWQSFVAYINLGCYYFIGLPLGFVMGWIYKFGVKGIWAGMIFGGTAIQTLILIFIVMRCDWEKEAQKASVRINKWSISDSEARN
ncbi:unnamed protein product [Brassica rapa subsp. trilocularis]